MQPPETTKTLPWYRKPTALLVVAIVVLGVAVWGAANYGIKTRAAAGGPKGKGPRAAQFKEPLFPEVFALSQDRQYLAACATGAGQDWKLFVLDVKSPRIVGEKTLANAATPQTLVWAPDGNLCYSVPDPNRRQSRAYMHLWNWKTGEQSKFAGDVSVLPDSKAHVDPTNRYYLAGEKHDKVHPLYEHDAAIALWKTPTTPPSIIPLPDARGMPAFLQGFTPDGNLLVCTRLGKLGDLHAKYRAELLDPAHGSRKVLLPLGEGQPRSLSLSPDGRLLAVARPVAQYVYDLATAEEKLLLIDQVPVQLQKQQAWGWSVDGSLLLLGAVASPQNFTDFAVDMSLSLWRPGWSSSQPLPWLDQGRYLPLCWLDGERLIVLMATGSPLSPTGKFLDTSWSIGVLRVESPGNTPHASLERILLFHGVTGKP